MDRFAFALNAVKLTKDAKLIANVNHKDNFTLWAARIAWNAIIESFGNLNDPKDIEEYNKLCDEATVVEVDEKYYGGSLMSTREYREIRITKSPLVNAVCHKAYEDLQGT